jgi:hypothetical protein
MAAPTNQGKPDPKPDQGRTRDAVEDAGDLRLAKHLSAARRGQYADHEPGEK